jgi:hypothetical protein
MKCEWIPLNCFFPLNCFLYDFRVLLWPPLKKSWKKRRNRKTTYTVGRIVWIEYESSGINGTSTRWWWWYSTFLPNDVLIHIRDFHQQHLESISNSIRHFTALYPESIQKNRTNTSAKYTHQCNYSSPEISTIIYNKHILIFFRKEKVTFIREVYFKKSVIFIQIWHFFK